MGSEILMHTFDTGRNNWFRDLEAACQRCMVSCLGGGAVRRAPLAKKQATICSSQRIKAVKGSLAGLRLHAHPRVLPQQVTAFKAVPAPWCLVSRQKMLI